MDEVLATLGAQRRVHAVLGSVWRPQDARLDVALLAEFEQDDITHLQALRHDIHGH